MADKSPIVVSVLDGAFLQLNEVGFPLPLCNHMKEKKLELESAQWTAKQTAGGFSVSFFWPVDLKVTTELKKQPRKRKKRRRRKQRKQPLNISPTLADRSQLEHTTPIDEHHHVIDKEKPMEHQVFSDLHEGHEEGNCSSQSEVKDIDESGCSDGQFGTESESESESDGDEIVKLADCDEVAFDMRDGTAGVIYCKDGTEGWTPVTK